MSAWENMLGGSVAKTNGETMKTSELSKSGRVVGLYFSAHWCPPCRGFTPVLSEFYQKMREKGKDLEMVFVSSDRDDASFKEYLGEMPWHALPFEERTKKAELSRKFKVQGIPTLVFLDENAKVITTDGRSKVAKDPDGDEFPWHPKPISQLFEGSYVKNDGSAVDYKDLDGKVLGIYFSAHWCPPCRGFTPELAKTHEVLKKEGKNFEIIFVSSDRSEESFKEYMENMPWLAVPFTDNQRRSALSEHFSVEGIPTLVILDEQRKTITSNGRAAVSNDPLGKEFPWNPKPVEKLCDDNAQVLNENICVIVLTDENEEYIKMATTALQEPAEIHIAAAKAQGEDPEITFLYEGEDSDSIVESLRGFLHLDDRNPQLVLVDIPSQQIHVDPAEVITKDVVNAMLAKHKEGSLEFRPLR